MPAATSEPRDLETPGYNNVAIPANEAGPRDLQALGYNVAIPANEAEPKSLGYSVPIPVEQSDAQSPIRGSDLPYRSVRIDQPDGDASRNDSFDSLQNLSTNDPPNATGPNPSRGLRSKPLGKKYVGEENGEGWRTNMKYQGQPLRTDYFSEERKNACKVSFDDEEGTGSVPSGGSDNSRVGLNGKKGFVVDPTTGAMHVFKENDDRSEDGVTFVTHHSSPLSGKPVAGAGMVTFEKSRITDISDQSGHYKPEAELTFQTVQELNHAAEESNGRVQSPLMNKTVNSAARKSNDLSADAKKLINRLNRIESEIEDSLDADPNADVGKLQEQAERIRDALISANIDLEQNKEATVTLLGKTGMLTDDEYSPLFRTYQAVTTNTASTDREKEQALEKLKKDVNRASALKQLQAPLGEAAYAKLLLTKKPTVDSAIPANEANPNVSGDSAMPDLGQPTNAVPPGYLPMPTPMSEPRDLETPGYNNVPANEAEPRDLETPGYNNVAIPANETNPNVSGYGAMPDLTQPTNAVPPGYLPMRAAMSGPTELHALGYNDAIPAKETTIVQAMRIHHIDPESEGAVKALKAALGAAAVENIKDDDTEIDKLSVQYRVVAIDREFDGGSERMGFEVGTKSAVKLTAQQFLQTGGNEAQIRTKQRLVQEIQPDKTKAGPKVALRATKNPEIEGKDASTETPDTPKGDNDTVTHPAITRLLKEFDSDLPSRERDLEQSLKQLKKKIEIASKPDGYTGKIDEKKKAELEQEMNALLQEIERSKKSVSNANPQPATDDHRPVALPGRPAEDPTTRHVRKLQQDADAERLQLIRVMLGEKINRMITSGLTAQQIHQILHDEEKVSHQDLDALGIPG
jgi:hypothetical protein